MMKMVDFERENGVFFSSNSTSKSGLQRYRPQKKSRPSTVVAGGVLLIPGMARRRAGFSAPQNVRVSAVLRVFHVVIRAELEILRNLRLCTLP